MGLNSLRTKINLIFLIVFILLMLIFGFLYRGSAERSMQDIQMQERANIHYLYLYYLKYGAIDEAYLDSQNIRVSDIDIGKLHLGKIVHNKEGERRFAVTIINLKRYIIINNDRFNIILENRNKPKLPYYLFIGVISATALLLVLYLWIIGSIRPLSRLKNEIMHFSEGNLNISCKSDKNDEIAEVANAFDYAAKTIRELIHARQLLLRAIMHELKTPIAKGRLLSEMVSDSRQRTRFHTIFERLNLLIDEFAKVEKIASKNFHTNFKSYKMSDIIDASIDMLMLNNPQKNINNVISQDFTINADFELLSLAIKNLLDNGIKYSSDKRVQVVVRDEKIIVSSVGEKLKEPLEKYFEPFHASRHGLGLGLYIVKSITDIHKMSLGYHHDNGKNNFIMKASQNQ